MPTGSLSAAVQHLLTDHGPDGCGAADGELLARFLRGRDRDALAAIVRRHAPMVWGVCRRVLRNPHDAEDAFQAAFLVLVRKAADVPGQAVAGWLYGVARQTAVRLRAAAAKRGRRETQVANMPEPTTPEARDAELEGVVDEELGRLPDHYRAVVVLCDLEGLSRREAASRLGIPEGSVASRLARARAMLGRRLARRGFAVPAAVVLSAGAASASAPPALVASTIEAAGRAAGFPARVAALAEGVVKAMFVTKIKGALAGALVAAALACTAGLFYPARAADPTRPGQELPAPGKQAGTNAPARPKPPAAKSDQERIVGGWVIVNEDSGRKGEEWAITADEIVMHPNLWGFRVARYFYQLDPAKTPKQIDIRMTKTNLEPVGVIKGIYSLDGDEFRLCLAEIGKERPAAFPEKPKRGEVLILHRIPTAVDQPMTKEEKLKVLIDKVLEAHGGEEKLTKLTSFTMTIKHSNGYTNHYFVRPPKDFRWEQQHRDQTGKMIVILSPDGRRWWTQEPGEEPKEFHPTGAELPVEVQLDRVKFFGPRQVLRLKDADHKVALLDGETKVGDRAAVGVEVTGKQFKGKMYFDKETHLLLKGPGADVREATFSDYKTFDGIPIARKGDDGHFMPEVSDFKVVEKFDDKLFEQP